MDGSLTDEDRMQFGRHLGEMLKDVPSEYLIWCADQPWIQDPSKASLRRYIEKNRDILEKEAEDHAIFIGRIGDDE